MAKEEETKATEEAAEKKSKDSKASGGKGGMLGLAIKALIVLVLSGGIGFGVGRFINASDKTQATMDTEQSLTEQRGTASDLGSQNLKFKYIDFEAVTSNLNDPRMTKHVMAKLTLSVIDDGNSKKIEDLIDQEKARLLNCLTIYFGNCTLNDVRGAKNQNRIRREIGDKFNELLWPGQKPLIREVFFKKFVVTS